jgi:hypothetical protein
MPITIAEGVIDIFRKFRPMGIPTGLRIPVQISHNDLKLSVVLKELTVLAEYPRGSILRWLLCQGPQLLLPGGI